MFNQTIRDFCQSQQDNETLALSIKFNSLSLSFIKYAIMHGIWHLTAINLCENSTNHKVTSSHKSLNLIMSVRNRYNQVQIYMQSTVEISGPNVSALSRRSTALFVFDSFPRQPIVCPILLLSSTGVLTDVMAINQT